MRDLAIVATLALLAALAFAAHRRLEPDRECRRCLGIGQLTRWHQMTNKPCPRCGGKGRLPRRWPRR